MKKVEEVVEVRKERFYKQRMVPAKKIQKEQIRNNIKRNIDLVQSSLVRERHALTRDDAAQVAQDVKMEEANEA